MRRTSVVFSSIVVILLGLCVSACISSYKFSHTEEKDFQVPAAGIATVDAQATNPHFSQACQKRGETRCIS
ncbi:MAG TPA: hypothetical protein PLQ35_05310, partial [bacterium]|nr:hypothetical protein [bacterium]HQL61693.1 hypothetical protein [bacterium]